MSDYDYDFDNSCIDCGKGIKSDYERCYDCNTEYHERELRFQIATTAAETEKALLVKVKKTQPTGEELVSDEVWLPKSQFTLEGDDKLWLKQWIAEEKAIDGYSI